MATHASRLGSGYIYVSASVHYAIRPFDDLYYDRKRTWVWDAARQGKVHHTPL